MSRALIRLTESLQNKPLLSTQPHLDQVLEYLTDRNNGVHNLKVDIIKKDRVNRETIEYNEDTGVGIIAIDGSLTYLTYQGLCGDAGISYKKIKAEFDYLVANGAKIILLDQDSNGGEAYMAFETAREMRKIADEKGVKLISYVDGGSFSASYVFSAVCHEIIVNPQGEVGSIGVVVGLRNTNKAERNMGVERTYVYSGKSKIPFDAEGDWDKAWLQDIQDKVDTLYGEFLSHVSLYRDVTKETLLDIGARTFFGADAVELGLADKVYTHEELGDYLATLTEESGMSILTSIKGGKVNMEEKLEQMQLEMTAKDAQLSEAQAGFVSLQEELDGVVTKLTQAEAVVGELTASQEALQAALDAALGDKVSMVKEQRKARLQAATNVETADSMFASLENLDDASFDAVVTGFEKQKEAMASSGLFTEVGSANAEVDTPAAPKSKTLELAQAQYKTK